MAMICAVAKTIESARKLDTGNALVSFFVAVAT